MLFHLNLHTPTIQWILVYSFIWISHSFYISSVLALSTRTIKSTLANALDRIGLNRVRFIGANLPISNAAKCANLQRSHERILARQAAKEMFSWKIYLCLGLIDLESHYLITRAFNYTNIVSIQLLDCTAIPVVIIASMILFRLKFRWKHILGSVLCVVGIIGLICADVFLNSPEHVAGKIRSKSTSLFGDLMVIGGAFLFAASELVQEFILKSLSGFMESRDATREVVSNLGFYGMFLALFQSFALKECHHFFAVVRETPKILIYFGVLVGLLILFYTLVPRLLQRSSAATMNLSLLTSDFWSLLASAIWCGDEFHPVYFFGLVIVILGIASFHWDEISRFFDFSKFRRKPDLPSITESASDTSDAESFMVNAFADLESSPLPSPSLSESEEGRCHDSYSRNNTRERERLLRNYSPRFIYNSFCDC